MIVRIHHAAGLFSLLTVLSLPTLASAQEVWVDPPPNLGAIEAAAGGAALAPADQATETWRTHRPRASAPLDETQGIVVKAKPEPKKAARKAPSRAKSRDKAAGRANGNPFAKIFGPPRKDPTLIMSRADR